MSSFYIVTDTNSVWIITDNSHNVICYNLAAMHICVQCAYPVVLKLVQMVVDISSNTD